MIIKPCGWCDKEFETKTVIQIYCSIECRTEATKIKVSERYSFIRSKKRQYKPRLCAGGCKTKLNIYNDSGFCNICLYNKKKLGSVLKELKGYFDYEEK
jgi:hypothetical protein